MDEARQERPHDILPSPDGSFPCPYLDCSAALESARERISHMLSAHRLETEARLSAIEEMLGGEWREKAACRGRGDAWISEPGSREKATARKSAGFREPSRGERKAIQICATCPVRRDCAKASLTPVPASTSLPMARPVLFEPYGLFAGVPADARKKLVEEFGTGPEALEALLRLGERFALNFPDRGGYRPDRVGHRHDRHGYGDDQ